MNVFQGLDHALTLRVLSVSGTFPAYQSNRVYNNRHNAVLWSRRSPREPLPLPYNNSSMYTYLETCCPLASLRRHLQPSRVHS